MRTFFWSWNIIATGELDMTRNYASPRCHCRLRRTYTRVTRHWILVGWLSFGASFVCWSSYLPYLHRPTLFTQTYLFTRLWHKQSANGLWKALSASCCAHSLSSANSLVTLEAHAATPTKLAGKLERGPHLLLILSRPLCVAIVPFRLCSAAPSIPHGAEGLGWGHGGLGRRQTKVKRRNDLVSIGCARWPLSLASAGPLFVPHPPYLLPLSLEATTWANFHWDLLTISPWQVCLFISPRNLPLRL